MSGHQADRMEDTRADLDRGELLTQMEPLLINQGSRHRPPLSDLTVELAAKSAGFLIVAAILVFSSFLSIIASEGQNKPGTPAEQYAALLREYRPASGGIRKAKTDLQRKAVVERLGTFPMKFLELAEKHPNDPIALVALKQAVQAVGTTDSAAQIAWETNRSDFPTGSTGGSASKTVTLLLRDHVLSAKLAPVCDRMRYGYRLEYEKFLRTVLEKNPHRNVQALACLSLAQFLNDRLRMLQLAEGIGRVL